MYKIGWEKIICFFPKNIHEYDKFKTIPIYVNLWERLCVSIWLCVKVIFSIFKSSIMKYSITADFLRVSYLLAMNSVHIYKKKQ